MIVFPRPMPFKLVWRIILLTFVVQVMPIIYRSLTQDESPNYKYSKEANEIYTNQHQLHKYHDHNRVHKHPFASKTDIYYKNYDHIILKAFGSTVMISVVPFLILCFVPLYNTNQHESLLKILISFASGGLLGDAFLRLIPHAFMLYSSNSSVGAHSHSHSNFDSHDENDKSEYHKYDISVGLCILMGLTGFLIVEKFIRINRGQYIVSNVHSTSQKKSEVKEDLMKKDKKEKTNKVVNKASQETARSDIKIAAYLNLIANLLHNFIDGLAIGASYIAGDSIGYATTFTILLHEIPHRIGDFAILIQSGFFKKKAILAQMITALGALLGTFVSILTKGADLKVVTRLIIPLTAGGFIYIATVSIMPELLTGTKLWQLVKEILALLLGVYMMVLIANYE